MVVVNAVLMYGLETWVMTPHIGMNLGGYHHKVERRMMRRKLQRGIDRRWRYPLLVEVMEEAGL